VPEAAHINFKWMSSQENLLLEALNMHLSARSAENQPCGECTVHVYKVAFELHSALFMLLWVVLKHVKSGSEQKKRRKLLS
jgi:glucokinase